MVRSRERKKQFVETLFVLTLAIHGSVAQAGLLQPLLQMLRPKLESQLADHCQRLAKNTLHEAFSSTDLDLEPFSNLGAQPCQALAKPVSECLILETSRSGRELGVLSEVLAGRIGDDADVVIKRCIASMLGLNPTDLQDVPLQDLLKRLR